MTARDISNPIATFHRRPLGALAVACWLLLTGGAVVRGDDAKPAPPSDEGVYETDRPGELENPFALPVGQAELVNYVVGINAAAREDDFGEGGSAVFLDTAVRFGVANGIEGVVTLDSFLQTNPPEGAGIDSHRGFGYATLLAKWNFLKSATGDFGVAIAPLVRLPLSQSVGGTSRSESGLIAPFDFDLEEGWEVEGSTSVSRAPQGAGAWSEQWENQASLERTLTARLTAYLELELESGDGPPAWATEFGFTARLNATVLIDIGGSLGLGRNSRGRAGYMGVGWGF